MHRTLESNQAVRFKANTFSAFFKTEIVARVLLSKHREQGCFCLLVLEDKKRRWMGGRAHRILTLPTGSLWRTSLYHKEQFQCLEVFSGGTDLGCCLKCYETLSNKTYLVPNVTYAVRWRFSF